MEDCTYDCFVATLRDRLDAPTVTVNLHAVPSPSPSPTGDTISLDLPHRWGAMPQRVSATSSSILRLPVLSSDGCYY